MTELTRETILKGQGQQTMHLNYGGGRGGYAYQHIQFPRLSWIDKHGPWTGGRPPREWFVDGASIGEGDEGLDAALLLLAKPVDLNEAEKAALAVIPAEFADLRSVEKIVSDALIEARFIDPGQARSYTFTVMHFLKAKGMTEIGREELPPGTTPIAHLNWRPVIRRRADG